MFNSYKAIDHLDGAKQVDLEEQVKVHRRELEKKDEVIRALTFLRGADDSPAGIMRNLCPSEVTLASPPRAASLSRNLLPRYTALGDTTRSEYAPHLVKYEGSETEVRDLQNRLKNTEAAMLHLRGELERSKENGTRQATLKDRMRRTQDSSETVASVKSQVNCSIRALQGENQELRDRVSELEERLRLHLREREQSEQRVVSAERKLSSSIEKLAHGLSVDLDGQRDPLDYLINQACEMFQERLLWETKVAMLEKALANQELEFKASRQALVKLASEADNAQSVATSFSEDMKTVRKERDEALILKAAAEQEIQLLRERLADNQRALGTACQAQAHNEKQVSDLDDNLRASAYQTKAAQALHQSFIDQLATLLSDGFATVPASEEAVKSKVREISGKDRVRAMNVARLEEEITRLNGQLESRSKCYHEAMERARKAEDRLSDREEAVSHLEGQLTAENLLKGGRHFERKRHAKFLRGLAEAMKVERDVWTDDLEHQAERLLARARELAELELERSADGKETLQNLQQKVTSQRERLAGNKRHIQLLTSKLSQLEAGSAEGRTTVGRVEQEAALAKLQQKTKRLQGELELVKRRNLSLREKAEEIFALKEKNKEQNRTIQRLNESLEKLEAIKEKAARKVVTLSSDLDQAEHGAWERNVRAQSLQEALSNELHSTKRALEEVARRERQLVDFREVVTRALGFNPNSMAVPEEEIYLKLKSLTQPHGKAALRTVSPSRGPADGVGGYERSWPSHGPPTSWGQPMSPPGSQHRGYNGTASHHIRT